MQKQDSQPYRVDLLVIKPYSADKEAYVSVQVAHLDSISSEKQRITYVRRRLLSL